METLLLSGEKKEEINLIIKLAKRLGIKTRKLTLDDVEEMGLLFAIKEGETGEFTDTDEFQNSIDKK